jgi:hypothetical protein
MDTNKGPASCNLLGHEPAATAPAEPHVAPSHGQIRPDANAELIADLLVV